MSRKGNTVFGIIKSRVRLPVGFVLDSVSRILRIILRGRKSLKSILNILNLKCVPAYNYYLAFRGRGACNLLRFDVSIAQTKAEMLEFTSLVHY